MRECRSPAETGTWTVHGRGRWRWEGGVPGIGLGIRAVSGVIPCDVCIGSWDGRVCECDDGGRGALHGKVSSSGVMRNRWRHRLHRQRLATYYMSHASHGSWDGRVSGRDAWGMGAVGGGRMRRCDVRTPSKSRLHTRWLAYEKIKNKMSGRGFGRSRSGRPKSRKWKPG